MRRMGWVLAVALCGAPFLGAAAQGTGSGPAAVAGSGSQGLVLRGTEPAPGAPPVVGGGPGAAVINGSAAGSDVIGGQIPPGGRSGTYSTGGMTIDGTGGAGMGGSTQGGIAGASKGAMGGPGPVSTDMGRPSGGP